MMKIIVHATWINLMKLMEDAHAWNSIMISNDIASDKLRQDFLYGEFEKA